MLLVPKGLTESIVARGVSWGLLHVTHDEPEGIALVTGFSERRARTHPADRAWVAGLRSAHASQRSQGYLYRAQAGLADAGLELFRRSQPMPIAEFRARLPTWNMPAAGRSAFALTFEADGSSQAPRWAAWLVTQDHAQFIGHEIVDTQADLLAPLDEGWPRQLLTDKQLLMIGLGSIGGVAAQALAAYGIRNFTLVDPGRLYARNFARHRAPRSEVGRLKVRAVADLLTARDPLVRVDALALNVDRDADQLRPLVAAADLVVICSDGTRSRRVGSHLAFRAGKPAVLGCVQGSGAYGEILRLVPGRTGCLLCNRAALAHALEPEPLGLELDYDLPQELGHPMTAVTGDLGLVGDLTAKAAVATLLQTAGQRSQRLAGDMGLIALRPEPDLPPPFDTLIEVGQTIWTDTGAPRPDCPTCGSRRA
jgi:hypothetical protein